MLVISCHADTGFFNHRLKYLSREILEGHLDNFIGVHTVMTAYFSGKLDYPYVRIELTYGEEEEMDGAKEVCETLTPNDIVMVVDVTAAPTKKDFVIEKCLDTKLSHALKKSLKKFSFDISTGTDDPVANEDESDVYIQKCPYTFFMGIPCTGGDYNAGMVQAKKESIIIVSEAILQIAKDYPAICEHLNIHIKKTRLAK